MLPDELDEDVEESGVVLGRGRVLCADTTTANKREKSRLESGLVNPINAIERRAGYFS